MARNQPRGPKGSRRLYGFGPMTAAAGAYRFTIVATNYNPEVQTLLLYWSLGSILVTGPNAEAFFERFSEGRIALVRADGKDIVRVTMSLRQQTD